MSAQDQKPLGSGLGLRTTATEALGGQDLTGKTAIVTGGYSGLGLEAVKALAAAGAKVIVPARRPDVAREALAGVANVEVATMDLGDLQSVSAFAKEFLASDQQLDILINNAAIMACPETRVGPNWEAQFATNHLGHFALVSALEPALKAAGANGGARVVSDPSTGHKISPIVFDDIHFENRPYEKWAAYGQAKSANALFALELDKRAAPSGLRAFSVHPGGIMTPLQRHLPREEMIAAGWMDEAGNVHEGFKTPEQGAATSVWCATSPMLQGKGGMYCEDCDVAQLTPSGTSRHSGVDAHAVDEAAASQLWAYSATATGTNAFV